MNNILIMLLLVCGLCLMGNVLADPYWGRSYDRRRYVPLPTPAPTPAPTRRRRRRWGGWNENNIEDQNSNQLKGLEEELKEDS
uniref:Uncharacterized protein n=1 Tax=Ciona savignyi TaxID=51511 RepID=H2YL29_CIOSA